jgi:general L-amino acid transport system substrate-binding protein
VLLPLAAHGQTLDHIRASNTLACAAETRPGFAEADDDGTIKGLAVDLCRAVAIAVLGPSGTVHMTLPDSDLEYADIAKGSADLVFLSPTATEEHGLEASLIPGPTVFIDPITAMVPANAPDTLAGKTICLMIGTQAQRAVETRLSGLTPPITRLPFREDVEMLDAYNVGRCDAVVDDATRLADMRQQTGINHLQSRLLSQPLMLTPLVAATPTQDGAWASLAFRTLNAVIGNTSQTQPGLRPGWQTEMKSTLGDYATMRNRNLGAEARP